MKRSEQGFSLLELLLASSLGLVLAGAALNSLFSEADLSRRLVRQVRERQLLGRAATLIRGDLERGVAVALNPREPTVSGACGLAGRAPVLQISGSDGSVTSYSVGKPPDPIWRGWVLMRCGRAFQADGSLNAKAAFQNRVVLDGLDPTPEAWKGCDLPEGTLLSGTELLPLAACVEESSGTLQWRLAQEFPSPGKTAQRLESSGSAQLGI
ncbi:MAG: prepilin-type N-terminal cleavage/methylation domain-containing protein [Synechococcus lacustris]